MWQKLWSSRFTSVRLITVSVGVKSVAASRKVGTSTKSTTGAGNDYSPNVRAVRSLMKRSVQTGRDFVIPSVELFWTIKPDDSDLTEAVHRYF